MNIKQLTYCLLVLATLSSCSQIKSLASRDNSKPAPTRKTATNRKVQFLDDISVTPGQVVTSNHSSRGEGPRVKKKTQEEALVYGSGNIERASYIQLKYAIMLDASVESLANVNLLQLIDEWWGTRYCMGGSTKNCIDCSAFVQILMSGAYNVSLPRTAQEQFNNSNKIGMEDLQEGDLVFFHTSGRDVSHVGVYMLNNKFVHASTSGGVMFNDLNDSYWRQKFRGAARVVNTSASVGSN